MDFIANRHQIFILEQLGNSSPLESLHIGHAASWSSTRTAFEIASSRLNPLVRPTFFVTSHFQFLSYRNCRMEILRGESKIWAERESNYFKNWTFLAESFLIVVFQLFA